MAAARDISVIAVIVTTIVTLIAAQQAPPQRRPPLQRRLHEQRILVRLQRRPRPLPACRQRSCHCQCHCQCHCHLPRCHYHCHTWLIHAKRRLGMLSMKAYSENRSRPRLIATITTTASLASTSEHIPSHPLISMLAYIC